MNSNLEEKNKKQASSYIAKSNFINEIDALYKSEIKKIYVESKEKMKETERSIGNPVQKSTETRVTAELGIKLNDAKDEISINTPSQQSSQRDLKFKKINLIDEQKIRASTLLKGQSTITIERLRKENETKEMKIRQLSNKCQNLIEKLKAHVSPIQFEKQMENMKQFSDKKMQRLQNLFKIKNEEIFFKIKLQIIALLQEFQISKEEIAGINEVNNESSLFSFLVRKLKVKLKDFKSKEQESNFQLQKDKILHQKNEERIHYLIETNDLLKLSETKLKSKIDDLRSQLNEFLDKIKEKQLQLEEKDNEIFRLKKHGQELQISLHKQSFQEKNIKSQKNDERRIYEAKEKEMKALLSSYYVERKKLENQLEEKQGYIQEILIKEKFLQQQNERMNREFIRWKERYEWLEKQKENRQKEFEEEKIQLINSFELYKKQNNQGVYLGCKAQTDQALRQIQQYRGAYQKLLIELEQQREKGMMKEEEAQKTMEETQKQWFKKIKIIEKMKEEEIMQISQDHETRQKQLKEQYERRQQMIGEELKISMQALLAENVRNLTEKLIRFEQENEDLKKEIQSLTKVLEVKESLITVLNSKKA